jgi:hypothetical protein
MVLPKNEVNSFGLIEPYQGSVGMTSEAEAEDKDPLAQLATLCIRKYEKP